MNEDDQPITPEVESYLDVIERRIAQGLAHHPFPDGITSGLIRLGNDGKAYNPSIEEITRLVSGWFVKKDNKFYDVNNLQVSYTAQDLKQVIVNRTKVLFPELNLSKKDLGDFFSCPIRPTYDQRKSRRKHSNLVRAYCVYPCE